MGKKKKINPKDIEKMIDQINDSFDPILKEINTNLSFLYECIGEKPHMDFDKITMKDIETK